MARRKTQIRQSEIVQRFAARLRELRRSRGMTQLELARRALVTASYVWKLEAAGATPGIDLVDRLAAALGTTPSDLLPETATPDTTALLRTQARQLFDSLVANADRETLLMLNPLLARLGDGANQSR